MDPHKARYSLLFIFIHWVLVLLLVMLFGTGWYLYASPAAAPSRSLLLDLHISLGLSSALFVLIQILLRLIFKTPPYSDLLPLWQQRLAGVLNLLMYLALLLMPASGYLEAAFSARAVYLWGMRIADWGVPDATLADFFLRVHVVTAWVLAGLIVLHIGWVVANTLNGRAMLSRMLVGKEPELSLPVPAGPVSPAAPIIVQALSRNLRLFGSIGFWTQFVLAFIAGLLLMIAAPGRAFSPGTVGLGDSTSWASYAFFLLCVAVLLTLYYIHSASKILSKPDAYLAPQKKIGFWFLGAGLLNGFLGIFIAFGGMVLSLSLLIAKTVSQPPGIAITDPRNIIRALDVFVLMVNFDLLLAHFIGIGVSLWLVLRASKARHEYVRLSSNHVG